MTAGSLRPGDVQDNPEEKSSKEGSQDRLEADTLGLPPRGQVLPSPPEPALHWDRYRDFLFLGQGGMGTVFSAADQQLHRQVAVKFLHKLEPARVKRFIQEARAQARVEHEHVAKIYDVGDLHGQPYIAMQLIVGQTLDLAAADMSLEQKLWTIQKVAEGVHAAHVAGLVHRDLKPGNIMVETGEGNKPYVLDFGLARLEESVSLTVEGTVLGTPSYMAPEQARGEVNALDRRTDVYALGATLYRLVTGNAPFPGSNQAQVLVEILEKDPPKPSQIVRQLPEDVETIILKCLEKEPQARYQSAQALAEDINRYLEGEPIQARSTSWWYRLAKLARKNRRLVRLGMVATVLLLSAVAWGLHTAWRGSVRENLIRTLTREVGEIEALARYSYLARRHNIRPDRARLRQKMDQIEEMGQQAGTLGRGPTDYALGRGFLALGDHEAARIHLDRAWAKGYRSSEVAYSLGLAYGALFRKYLTQLYLLEDGELRRQRRRELERAYRDPALNYMRLTTGGDAVSQDYLKALIAYYEEDYGEAADLLVKTSEERPWYYEAKKLEADILRDWAVQKSTAGEVTDARTLFDKARFRYTQAAEVAQSNPAIYKDLTRTLLNMMELEVFAGEKMDPLLEEGLQWIEAGLETLPEDDEAFLLAARLHLNMAQQRQLVDKDPEPELARATALATRSRDLSKDSSPANLLLGHIYWRQAQWLTKQKQDSQAKTRAALEALSQVAAPYRDHAYHNTIGLAAKSLARWLNRSGHPACDEHDRAIEAFREVAKLRPEKLSGYNNLAGSLIARSGQDACSGKALEQLDEASQALQSALGINPNHPVLRYQLGRTYMRMARQGVRQRTRLNVDFARKALDQYEQAIDLNPKIGAFYNAAGLGHVALARQAWDYGGDPDKHFENAFLIYEKGLEITPNSRLLQQNLAWAYYYQGKYQCRTNQDPTAYLDSAITWSEKALNLGEALDALLCLGSAYRMKAEHQFQQGGDPSAFIEKAGQGFERILSINHEFTEAFRSLGRLHTLEFRWHLRQGASPEPALDKARVSLSQARAHHKDQLEPLIAGARLVLWEGIWSMAQKPQTGLDLEQGIDWVNSVLEVDSDRIEAKALKLCLLGLQDKIHGKPLATAHAELKQLLRSNPNLAFHWESTFSSIKGQALHVTLKNQ